MTFLQIDGPVTFQFALAASIFIARALVAFQRTTWWQRKKIYNDLKRYTLNDFEERKKLFLLRFIAI